MQDMMSKTNRKYLEQQKKLSGLSTREEDTKITNSKNSRNSRSFKSGNLQSMSAAAKKKASLVESFNKINIGMGQITSIIPNLPVPPG